MAIFNNMSITNKGQILYAKAQSGIELHFTKMMVGSGAIGTQNPATLTKLVDPKYDVSIQSITPNTEAKIATISGMINNANITKATYVSEIGLFAQDPDEGEILYAYGSAGAYGDYMAPATAGPYSWNYQINAAIGNAANVTVELSSLVYDYGVVSTNVGLSIISGGNQKEINKSIDTNLLEGGNVLIPISGSTVNSILLNIKTLINYKKYSFRATANSTGNVTINGKAFKKLDGTQIGSGGIKANKIYDFYYDNSANCVFILAKAEGDSTDADVLAGKIYSNGDDVGRVGTMSNIGAVNVTLSDNNQDYMIPLGFHNGLGKVKAIITNLVASVIKAGVTVGGIVGTFTADATAVAADIVSGKSAYVNGTKIIGNATIESLGAKRFKSGTVTATNDGNIYIDISAELTFTPKVVIATVVNTANSYKFTTVYDLNSGYKIGPGGFYTDTNSSTTVGYVNAVSSITSINLSNLHVCATSYTYDSNNHGNVLPYGSYTVNWSAYS